MKTRLRDALRNGLDDLIARPVGFETTMGTDKIIEAKNAIDSRR
jgi:hypothetical protein